MGALRIHQNKGRRLTGPAPKISQVIRILNRQKKRILIKSGGGNRPDEARQPVQQRTRCQILRHEPADEGTYPRPVLMPGRFFYKKCLHPQADGKKKGE